MKRILYTLSLIIAVQSLYAQLANVHFFVRTDRMFHNEGGVGGACWESGTEEYTGYGGFRDDANTGVTWSSCQQCNTNGNCTYGTNVNIGNRINDAYRIDPYVDGWEDDRGSRCSWDGSSCWNPVSDDCRTGPGDRGNIFFRELDFPNNNYTAGGLNSVGGFGDNDFQVWFDIYWFYTGNTLASTITPTCDPQIALQTTGAIRSQSVFLTAGVPYRFETTSGNDTYLRLYGSDGYTIVALDDDGGTGFLSRILYTPTTSGWYYIETSEFIRVPLTSSVNLEYVIDQTPSEPAANDVSGCIGQNVTLTATPSAGGTIRWYLTNSSTTVLATGNTLNLGNSLAAGIYYRYVSETGSAGCESTRREVQITVVAAPDAPFVTDATICPGTTASLLANNPPGATNPATNFNWYTSATLSPVVSTGAIYNTTVLNTPPTSYTFYVAGVLNGCVGNSSSAEVTFYQANMPTASADMSICSGDNTTLTASSAGSTEIRWYLNSDLTGYIQSGGSFTTPNLTNNITYYVSATYANGCESQPEPIVITINPLAQAPILQDASFCTSEDVILNATNVSGTISWYSDAALNTLLGTGASLNIGTQTMGVYNYFAQVNNGTCNSSVESNTIQVFTNPSAPTVNPATICEGEQANLSVSSSNTVNWYTDAALNNLVLVGSSFTTPVLTTNTTYYVTVSNVNCESAATSVLVTVNAKATAPTAMNVSVCMNESATLMASGSGGTITWYSDAALSNQIATGNSYTTPNLNSNTSYYITENNGNCDSDASTVNVTINPLAQSPILQDGSFCSNEDVILMATNVNGTISWYSDAALNTLLGTGASLNIGMQTTGVYNYFAQVNNGTCNSVVESNTVQVFASPAAPFVNPATICEGEQANLAVSSSNTVNWYSDAGLSNLLLSGSTYTTPVLNSNTTYWVTQSNANCESNATTVLVTVNTLPNAPTAMNDSVCLNESATLTATSSGGTISWYSDAALNNQIATGNTYITPNLSSNTTYFLTENDGNCESASSSVTVYINSLASAPILTDEMYCESEDVILMATNVSGTITWYSDAALTNSLGMGASLNIGMQPSGTYNFFAQANNGTCNSPVVSNTVEVFANPIAPSVTPQTICAGDQATLIVTSPNDVKWYEDAAMTNLLFVGSSFTTPALNTNTTYYVTNLDANACESVSNSVLVTVVAKPNPPIGINDTVCKNQSATLMASGGAGTFTWFSDPTLTNQLGTGPSFTTSLISTTTTYYVLENNGICDGNATPVYAVVNSDIVIAIDLVTDVLCFGNNTGAIYTSVTGGNGVYTYSWTGGGSNQDLIGAFAGTYVLTVTDGIGCSKSISATIGSPSVLQILLDNIDNVSCNGLLDGSVAISISGGTSNYTYAWRNSSNIVIATTNDLNNVGADSYSVTVTDANGCTASLNAVVGENPPLMGDITTSNILCFGGTSSASVNVTGGAIPYTYLWSNFENGTTASNLNAGVISVLVTDDNGCSINVYDTITGPSAPLEIMDSAITHITCFNGNDGAIYTNITGGTTPYTISWSPNAGTGDDITNLTAGMYTITVTDANGCVTSATYQVDNALEIISTMAVTNPTCFGEETGMIVVGNSGGTAPYTYTWNTTPPQTGVIAINLAGNASYTVSITDANGCAGQNTDTVIYPLEMTVSTIPTSVSCISTANGSVTVQVQNGNDPLQYELNGFLQSDSVFENLAGGNYVVFVEDNNNCTASASFNINTVSGMEAELEGAGNDLQYYTDNLYIVRGEEVRLNVNLINDVGNPIVGYNWNPSSVDSSGTQATPSFFPEDNIVVTVEVLEDINGSVCSVFDTLYIDVSQESIAFIPTAFSPNNNGANNFFEMNVLGAENLAVQIFNRWGEMVFYNDMQGNGPNNINDISLMDGTNPRGAWDGKYNGEDAPTGSYAYKVEVTYFDGTKELISGSVTLIR